MSDHLDRAEQYRQRAEELVALAKAATGNKIRANHYASAVRYLQLAEAESKLAVRSDGPLRSRVEAFFPRPAPTGR